MIGLLLLAGGCHHYVKRVQARPPSVREWKAYPPHHPRVVLADRWGISPAEITTLAHDHRLTDGEVGVVLFLSRHSGRPPRSIARLRGEGETWTAICSRVGLTPLVLFAEVPPDADIPPPYRGAYERYHRHRKDPRRLRVPDAACVALVEMHLIADRYGLEPIEVMEMREHASFREILAAMESKREEGTGQGGEEATRSGSSRQEAEGKEVPPGGDG